jgi:hypothetical protein
MCRYSAHDKRLYYRSSESLGELEIGNQQLAALLPASA